MRALTNWPGQSRAQVVADFNNDGISDFATSNNNPTGTVAVALGNGDGTFQPRAIYGAGTYPGDLLVGDFNNDGTNDLAMAGYEASLLNPRLVVLLGKGNGTLQTNVFYHTTKSSSQIAAIDFNHDGVTDVMGLSISHLEVLSGNGNGTFQTGTNVFATTYTAQTFGVGDFNADGWSDVVVGNVDDFLAGTIYILFNDHSSGFTPGPSSSIGLATNLYNITVANLNGDTLPDVVVANRDLDSIAVFLGQGNGQFQPVVTYPTGHQPFRITVGDFNGDSTNDLAVADEGDFTTTVFLTNGNGSFHTQGTYKGAGSGINCGDFNSDGILDLIAVGAGVDAYPNVYYLLGNGDGSFQETPVYGVGRGPRVPVTGDFNGDGKLDLAVPNSSSNNVSALLNNGDGTYGTNVYYFTGKNPSSIVVGDFNKDNKLDLLVANLSTNYVSLLLGNGNGTFQTNVIAITQPTALGVTSVAVGDFNHTNNLDVAIATPLGLYVYPGNSNGTFGAAITSNATLYNNTINLTAANLNADNNLDLIIVNGGTNFITILFGNANGTFQAPVTNLLGSVIGGVAIGDINGDGKLDIAAADRGCSLCTNSYYNGKIYVLLGNGNGTFQSPTTHLVDAAVQSGGVAIGDVNNDGKPDLISSGGAILGFAWVLLNNGDGTFQKGVPFVGRTGAAFLTTADVDADGRLDLVTSTGIQSLDSVAVFRNNCPAIPPALLTCTLTPALATNTVNTAHTVTAAVTSNGTAAVGTLVNFNVTAGPNLGQSGTATTSIAGQGSFTYTGTTVGTDTIRAIGGGSTAIVTKVWIASSCPTITVSPTTLLAGTVGTAYNQAITAGGGQAPRTFAVTTGTLPGNLNLSNAGTISGTPTNQGVFGFTITATDANSCNGSQAYTLTVNDVPPIPHDLAVVKLKAPKKITFKSGVTSVTGKFTVSIQNNATHDEVIPDFAALQNLVTVSVQSLSNCPSFAATMTLPKKAFPLALAPKKKLTLAFTGAFNCVNDPLPSSKTAAHPDYRMMATVDLSALGESDTTSSNDACPRPPGGSDPGCGSKTSTGTLGADVLIDAVVK